MLTVSVVIPARNDGAALRHAVESVEAQLGLDIDNIVIAVGPSSDCTHGEALRLAAHNPAVVVVESPTGTTPSALNLAISVATGSVIVRVDARSVLPNDYVANALATMEDTGAANVGAIQKAVGRTRSERAIAAAMTSRLGSGGARYRHATTRVKAETGYLGVFRREVLDEVGGYDESFIRNQDSELNIRLRKAGHEIWLDPRMIVVYTPRPHLLALASQFRQYGWWRAKTIRKHPSSLRIRQVAAPLVVVLSVVSIVLAFVLSRFFLAVPGAYLLAIVAAAIRDGDGLSLVDRAHLALALVVMHTAWATGFISSMAWPWTRA